VAWSYSKYSYRAGGDLSASSVSHNVGGETWRERGREGERTVNRKLELGRREGRRDVPCAVAAACRISRVERLGGRKGRKGRGEGGKKAHTLWSSSSMKGL